MPKPTSKPAPGMTATATLNDEDTDWLIEIMRAGGHGTPEGAIRTALWNYARHLGLDCPPHVFKLSARSFAKR